jgi:glutamate/tyrosine decarboxylase-like PLP-dependent enzyme
MDYDRPGIIREAGLRAGNYIQTVCERPVTPDAAAVAGLAALGGPLPETPSDPLEVLKLLDEVGSPATIANAGGRFFGFVSGGAVPAAVAANILAAAWDQNAGLAVSSPVAAKLEEIVLEWVRELLGLPRGVAGALVTGATMANFTCMAAARHALLARAGWDVESRGLFGAPPFPVVIGEEAHASLRKALALTGLGRDRVITVPTDSQGRIRADALPRLTEPAIFCIQAGNVNTGAFDPAQEICDAVRQVGGWVHVDGAFGLWAACVPGRAHLVHGFPQADSWATDAHKWLNVPYDCGISFVRDREAAFKSMSMQAAYLQEGTEREPMHWTPEASRRARGVEVWAALRSLGRSGLADLIEGTCRHAARFAAGLRQAGYEVLNDVVLNQVLVSFGSDALTKAVIDAIQRDGVCWCGGTVWHSRHAMRISVSSWVTDQGDVERSLAAILRLAGEQAALH